MAPATPSTAAPSPAAPAIFLGLSVKLLAKAANSAATNELVT